MIFKNSNFNKVGFPHEHGSWGFFFEPIILAILIAYSFNGVLLGLCSFFLFLSYQPMSFILKGNPKYLLKSAILYFFSYSVISLLIMYLLQANLQSIKLLVPFFMAVLLMVLFKLMERKNLNRNIVVEIIPQIAVALMSISILLVDNWEIVGYLLGFVIIVFSRSIQTVFYINNKLKFFKGTKPNKLLVNIIGFLFLIVLIILFKYNFVPWSSLIAVILLIIRSIVGFNENNKSEKVKIVGIKEFIYGFLFVVINSIGYNFGF